MSEDKGIKHDVQKTMHELVPPFAQEQYAKVLTFGAKKYAPHNWELGMKWSRIIGAIKRHTLAIERGEDYDPETGLLHSAHIQCESGFLTEYYKIYPQGDDRESEIMRGYKIGLDIDDVIADFVPAYCERYNVPIPFAWYFDREFMSNYNKVIKDHGFWLNLKPKCDPNTIPFEPHCYITSRGCPKEWSEEWLDKNGFPRVKVIQIETGSSKVEVGRETGIDIFVDDCYKNFIELTKAGIFTYLFDTPHNKRYSVGHRRIHSLTEIFNRSGLDKRG
jgi:hypothetical protein